LKSSYRYTPFGEQVCTDGEKAQEEFLYNAEAYDAVSGSYYMRVRFYEPAAMRFYQPDIVRGDVKKPQSLNRYVYVQNNPVMYEDTSGGAFFRLLSELG
jgi:RHS repeat-associated protein